MGFFDKIKQGLKKTSDAVNHSLDSVFAAFVKVDDDLLEELEEALILSDVGASTAAKNWSDDDPWAKPAVSNASPQSADGFAPNEPAATPAPEEHHKKHVAVPDISDGVDPETGNLIYRDLNEDGKISTSDRTYIGDPNPDFIYGLTNTFTWKDLSLSIFIQGSYGNDIFNVSRMETEGMYDGKNQSTEVLKRWRIPGQITSVPRANFNIKNSTYFVEDGSYLRVKDISLSYNIRCRQFKKWGISRVQPYFTASNLLTWTSYSGMDPEVNQYGNSGSVQGIDYGTYPQSKAFVFGINVEF